MNAINQSKALKVQSPFGGRKVIDIDTHYSEPHDLWTKRAPAKFKSRVPQVGMLNGQRSWIIDENKPIGLMLSPVSAVLKDGSKSLGMDFMELALADVHDGCSGVKPRVALMDTCGIAAQILYPNVLGFGGQGAAAVDFELRLVCTQIWNDAMAEIQEESGQRIFPMALLPWWDAEACAKEVLRCQKMGLRGININPDPHEHRGLDGQLLPDLANPYWDRLWEICAAHDLPVTFHISSGSGLLAWQQTRPWSGASPTTRYVLGSSMAFLDNGTTIANLVFSGLLDRHPKLKFVSVESGVAWVPFLMDALDYQYSEAGAKLKLQMKPSEYIKKHIYTSFWFERRNLALHIKTIGVDNVMFETDFPHPTCLYPIDDVEGAFAGLSSDEINKVLYGNAKRVYNLPV